MLFEKLCSKARSFVVKEPLLFMTLPTTTCDVSMKDAAENTTQTSEAESLNLAETSDNQDQQLHPNDTEQSATCVVCGDDGAKMHYNVLACLG